MLLLSSPKTRLMDFPEAVKEMYQKYCSGQSIASPTSFSTQNTGLSLGEAKPKDTKILKL